MGVYTQFKNGYAKEAIFGTSTITAAGDTAYLWGILPDRVIHPSPRTSLIYGATGVGAVEVTAGMAWKRQFNVLTNTFTVGMQNGILCWAVMGASSTAGAGPYVHTITPATTVPSFTMQHEATGTATAWSTQITGCKVAAAAFTCGLEQKYLLCHLDWIGKKPSDPGFQLTADPALPATATTAPYVYAGMTRTFDGATVTGLVDMEFSISPDILPVFAHTWDTGTYTGQWVNQLIEGPLKEYELMMHVIPESDDMWDELVAQGNTKNIVFKWAKSTNDYIQFTLTDCHFLQDDTETPKVGDSHLMEVHCKIERVSIEVKDSIAAAAYGE